MRLYAQEMKAPQLLNDMTSVLLEWQMLRVRAKAGLEHNDLNVALF